MIRSGEAGLTKKSCAPACMAWTTVSMPPVAVSTTTGWREAAAAQLLQRRQPAQARHDQVEHDGVGGAAGDQPVDRLLAGFGMGDSQALALQHRLDQPPLGRIVVDDENRLGHEVHTSTRNAPSCIGTALNLSRFRPPQVKAGFRRPEREVNGAGPFGFRLRARGRARHRKCA